MIKGIKENVAQDMKHTSLITPRYGMMHMFGQTQSMKSVQRY
jgi:hypothetical protein